MAYGYSCYSNYWEFFPNKKLKRYKRPACFSSIFRSGNTQSIVYICDADQNLSNDEISFYLNFLESFLDKSKYKFNYKEKSKKILFKLNCIEFNRIQSLLYLTAFRVLQEFPEIVKDLFLSKDLSSDELFNKFLFIHCEYSCGTKKLVKYNKLDIHGLYYNKYDGNAHVTTTEQFKQNFLLNKSQTVQCFFLKNL